MKKLTTKGLKRNMDNPSCLEIVKCYWYDGSHGLGYIDTDNQTWYWANGNSMKTPDRWEHIDWDNKQIIRDTIQRLMQEAEKRFPISTEVCREEIIAWLVNCYTFGFAKEKAQGTGASPTL